MVEPENPIEKLVNHDPMFKPTPKQSEFEQSEFGRSVAVLFLMFLTFCIGSCVADSLGNNEWKKLAIEHKAAHYNTTTGHFQWNDEKTIQELIAPEKR